MGRFKEQNEIALSDAMQTVLDTQDKDYVDITTLTYRLIEKLMEQDTIKIEEITNNIIEKIYDETDLHKSDLQVYQQAVETTSEDYESKIDNLEEENKELEEENKKLRAKLKGEKNGE